MSVRQDVQCDAVITSFGLTSPVNTGVVDGVTFTSLYRELSEGGGLLGVNANDTKTPSNPP